MKTVGITGRITGKDNIAAGSPYGGETIDGTDPPPKQFRDATYYGTAVSATITRSSTTATVTATAHGNSLGGRVKIVGADQEAYNGTKVVTSVADADTFTFVVYGSPTSPATGTITATPVFNDAIGEPLV